MVVILNYSRQRRESRLIISGRKGGFARADPRARAARLILIGVFAISKRDSTVLAPYEFLAPGTLLLASRKFSSGRHVGGDIQAMQTQSTDITEIRHDRFCIGTYSTMCRNTAQPVRPGEKSLGHKSRMQPFFYLT